MNNTKIFFPVQYETNEELPLMTVFELAEYLGIGRNTAYELLRTQTIQGFRIGRTWKVSKETVDMYIKKNSKLI